MIFEWQGSYPNIEYYINWSHNEEPYDVLYLHYKNISKTTRMENGQLVVDNHQVSSYITIYPSHQRAYKKLPALPAAEYCFELFDNPEKKGESIYSVNKHVGKKIKVNKIENPLGNGFSELCIFSPCKLPREQYGLIIKSMREIPFDLPPMKQTRDGYETACIIVSGKAKHVDVYLGSDIRDFVEIVDEGE